MSDCWTTAAARNVATTALFLTTFAATGAVAKADICSVVMAPGSGVDGNSAIYDRSGLRLPVTLKFFCRFKPSQVSTRFWVHDVSGRLFNVRDMWDQAASLMALPNVRPVRKTVASRAPSAGDTWSTVLLPEFNALSQLSASGESRCTAASVECSELVQLLRAPEARSRSHTSRVTFSMGRRRGESTLPSTGAVIESSVSTTDDRSDGARKLYETAALTLYMEHHPYTVARFLQELTLSSPLDYRMGARIGASVPSSPGRSGYYNFQAFKTEYRGATLSLAQTDSQGRDFNFCPPVTLTFKTPALPVTAVMQCSGHVDAGYDVQLAPTVGYFRLQPSVQMILRGQLLLNGGIAVGTLEGDLTLADFGGSTGAMYGLFNDSAQGELLAVRPFSYYAAKALNFTITATLRTSWGATPGTKTLYSFSGTSSSLAPVLNDWRVLRVRT